MLFKIIVFYKKTLVSESFLIKLQALRTSNLLKKDSNTGIFLRKTPNHLELNHSCNIKLFVLCFDMYFFYKNLMSYYNCSSR